MSAKLFVTDYGSYNAGQQFKHGHWVDLTQFSDLESFQIYLDDHFREVGIEDPEIMFTDFEGFPKALYSESYDEASLEKIFKYIELDIENWDDNDWVNAHNEYCSENSVEDEIYPFDDDFFETFFSGKPMEAARAASFGELNWSDDYIQFNGYGNLVSFNNPEDHIDKGAILEWYLENN